MTEMRHSRPAKRSRWLLLAVSISGVLAGLDGTAVVIAAPNIAQTVHASPTQLQWITNSYLVALAVGLLPAGRFVDRLGHRRGFVLGVALFGLLSLPIALATSATMLITLRAAQGLAGALMQPAAMALLRVTFPPPRLNPAIGVLTAATAASAAGGPIIAGTIVEHFGWPAVFLLNLPLTLVTALLGRWSAAESRGDGAQRPPVRAVLRLPGIGFGVLLVTASYFAIYGLLFVLTLYLQNLRGLDPVAAGLWLLPLSAVVVLSAPLGGVLTTRFGAPRPALAGMALVVVTLAGLSMVDGETTLAGFTPIALLGGTGAGIALVAGTQAIIGVAPTALSGLASAVQQTVSQLGGVLGIGVLGAVLSWRVGEVLPAELEHAALPEDLVRRTLDNTGDIAQGTVPVPPATTESVTAALTAAGRQAFLEGLHTSLLVAALVTAVGSVLAAMIRSTAESAGPPDAAADVDGERRDQQRTHHKRVQ
ncbi:MFS transporter [Actinopolyspora mortivallis]|uniref:MFS transporter n=1 Tax=Actinopolyspora mortivallis TaxID=33906 RepID=UPI00047EE236|nr:MFS transporter [Actinopolyspora mortivallis]